MDVLCKLQPEFISDGMQLRVQLTVGLINSSRYTLRWAGPEATRENIFRMAFVALDVNNQQSALVFLSSGLTTHNSVGPGDFLYGATGLI